MIEKFNGIFYLTIFIIHFIGYAFYGFRCVVQTQSFLDKYYGSKYDKAKTEECHSFIASTIPNGAERVNKVAQTLY